ncbi:MAG: right-handed parallel beta-helix repeat-containing protein [Lentisphaerae bacterium]|nr:right-handed parallel beta-helix repeat-containing protein [Lentisphaerota bacterium]
MMRDVRQAFYASPEGDDNNPGTARAAFRTLARARDAVRAVNKDMTGDIVVWLDDGVYLLDETLKFDPDDSGTNGHFIVYRAREGATPVLSGARTITGWKPDTDGRWKASCAFGKFRQLYVNGGRAGRARGAPPAMEPWGNWDKIDGLAGYTARNTNMPAWRNQADIEFGYLNEWSHMICKVAHIEAARTRGEATIVMQQPGFYLATQKETRRASLPAYVENVFELLGKAGEWYHDRSSGMLYYLPREGEDMASAQATVPALERLMELRGSPDRPICNVRFQGITFRDATWLRPSEHGFADLQANFVMNPDPAKRFMRRLEKECATVACIHSEALKSPANIVLHAARSVQFEQCTFTRLGGAGMDIERGSQGNIVKECSFHDISGSAIQVGDVRQEDHHPGDSRLIVKDNRIVHNRIHNIGVEYEGSIGVFAGYTNGTVIADNEIYDLPYSGISVGWGWGEEDAGGGVYVQPFYYDTPTPAGNNRIERNHIHHVMLKRNDGGGIYTLGDQPGTVIIGNHVHDNAGVPGGIYLDEGSGHIEVAKNHVRGVAKALTLTNRPQNRDATCRIHNNRFE